MNVLKRDNREENYDIGTIRSAISKANKSVSKEHRIEEDLIDKITDKVNKDVFKTNKEIISVEDIQDLVEQELIKANCYEIAKSYILYRDKRTKERNKNSKIHKLMEEKLNASNVVNQNANLDEHSFGGRRGEMDSAYLKQEALDYYMSERFANNHKKNRIYVHK